MGQLVAVQLVRNGGGEGFRDHFVVGAHRHDHKGTVRVFHTDSAILGGQLAAGGDHLVLRLKIDAVIVHQTAERDGIALCHHFSGLALAVTFGVQVTPYKGNRRPQGEAELSGLGGGEAHNGDLIWVGGKVLSLVSNAVIIIADMGFRGVQYQVPPIVGDLGEGMTERNIGFREQVHAVGIVFHPRFAFGTDRQICGIVGGIEHAVFVDGQQLLLGPSENTDTHIAVADGQRPMLKAFAVLRGRLVVPKLVSGIRIRLPGGRVGRFSARREHSTHRCGDEKQCSDRVFAGWII